MNYLKEILDDIVRRIISNPKTTTAGIFAVIGYLASVYGFNVPENVVAAIATIILALLGLLSRDD